MVRKVAANDRPNPLASVNFVGLDLKSSIGWHWKQQHERKLYGVIMAFDRKMLEARMSLFKNVRKFDILRFIMSTARRDYIISGALPLITDNSVADSVFLTYETRNICLEWSILLGKQQCT
ncbi:hypothetical protein TNCV_2629691 [Trichonephila clavipes]|uniref:Uncharacterized protein n=1 Tax=Trichonephila clavipes TaxID=2585209 RepID=A0A8X6SFK3_TRICX|nr:hypothetical protein TNCV_2629691 [Trichonephila clavipes]